MKTTYAVVLILLLAVSMQAQTQVITPVRGFSNEYTGTGYTVMSLSATANTVITANTILAQTVMCASATNTTITVTMTDTAGNKFVNALSITANSAPQYLVNALAGIRMVGLNLWASSASVINCVITGKN